MTDRLPSSVDVLPRSRNVTDEIAMHLSKSGLPTNQASDLNSSRGLRGAYRTRTRCRSSSNQLSTSRISGSPTFPDVSCPATKPMNRPSGRMS